MTDFTRLTVLGSTHRCELVVPSDEILGAVLPRILDLLQERPGPVTRALRLLLPTGEQLDVDRTPNDQRLLDGAVVRLVRAEEAPPPPEVADVPDVLGDELASRRDLWSAWARTVTGSVALAAIGAAGSALVPAATAQRMLVATGVLLLAAVLAGRLGPAVAAARTLAAAATALALGIAARTAVELGFPSNATATGWVLPLATGLGLLGWTCVGVGYGVGLGSRPLLAGSLLGLGTASVPLVASDLGAERAAAVGAAVAVVACGLLPRYAASAAGLTTLDSAVLEGSLRRRDEVQRAVDSAYASLSWSVFGLTGTLAATSGVLLGSADPWAMGLGVVVALVTAVRTRGFPLAAQQAALWFAVLGGVLVGGAGQAGRTPTAVAAGLAGLALGIVLLLLARPPAHTRAVFRQLGDVTELLAVVAMVPIGVGLFGIYGDLLGTFS
jgi:WXG100 protein secretion system (Wss), protein YukD